MDFDALKEVLQNWLSPEDAGDDVEEVDDEVIEEKSPTKNYALKTPLATKTTKADQFDSLFDEDEDNNDLPF
jgi:hypothetical protein